MYVFIYFQLYSVKQCYYCCYKLVDMLYIKAESCVCVQEADNWTTLSADVEEVLDSGDVDAVSCMLAAFSRTYDRRIICFCCA